jgi:dipeptidyl aminopeptidase/acylaminoacyl peptidase
MRTNNSSKQLVFTLIVLIQFLFTNPILAQENKPEWTPKDIINTKSVVGLEFSPNGKMAVWAQKKGVEKKDKFVYDLYLTRFDLIKDGKPRSFQLTNGDDSDYSPLFSKDNETIYFLSSREKGKKLWSISIYGGESKEVKTFKNGISDINWMSESKLSFVSNDGKSLYEQELEKIKDNTIVVEDSMHWTISKVYSYDLETERINSLTSNLYPVEEYEISTDSKYIITAHKMSPHAHIDGKPAPTFFLKNLNSGTRNQILKGLQEPYDFQFNSSNTGFYFMATSSSDPEWVGAGIRELYYYDLSNNNYNKINLDWALGIGRGYSVTNDNLVVSLANNTTRKLAYYQKNGNTWKKLAINLGIMNDHASVLNIQESGVKIAFVYSTASKIPVNYVADISIKKGQVSFTNQKEFAVLNANLKKKKIAKSEILKWQGANDEAVDGILYYPIDYSESKRYPLILSIHGGPSGTDIDSWSERWSTYPQIYAEKGAFVLKPNYHGSSNHGQKFVESIKGHYYDLEEVDIINGINVLIDKGMVDKEKLGTMGWSNGAILTTMLTLRYPDMFKFAAAGAGDVNWTSDYGTCQFGVTFDQSYFGGAPWDDMNGKTYNEKYILKSPLFEIEKIKTPTIIFHGSADRAVPRDQGWEYYRGLQQVNKAPVKFLWFPGQPHGLGKITHQLRKMNEEIEWVDKYLFDKESNKNEALKEGSPIALLLKKETSKKYNGYYGLTEGGTLIPEVISTKNDSISISKFEVTNEQYKTYDNSYVYKYGTANHPVYKLTPEDVTGYIAWLNNITGKKYRLPNKKEAEKLQEKAIKAADNQNTINYWAGYKMNSNDIKELKLRLSDTHDKLIEEVGKFKPIKLGKNEIYDLGGNVSEYYQDGNTIKTYGFSAYDHLESNYQLNSKKKKYTGIRLILE